MVDRQGILDHLRELEASLQDWERYAKSFSLEDLKRDRDKRNGGVLGGVGRGSNYETEMRS